MQVGGIQLTSSGSTAALSGTGSAVSYDPRDTNKDGVVSFAEQLAYSQKHLAEQTSVTGSGASLGQYGQSGALGTAAAQAGTLDTYA